MTNGRIAELAKEAADCIESCDLTADEMEEYLAGFLKNVVDEAVTGRGERPPTKATRRQRGRKRT